MSKQTDLMYTRGKDKHSHSTYRLEISKEPSRVKELSNHLYTKILQDNFIPLYRKQRLASFKKEENFHSGQRAITYCTLYDSPPSRI